MNFNPLDMLKNIQKLQEEMGSVQQQLAKVIVTGTAGGGMIEIDMNGKMELTAIRISQDTMDMRDKDMLEDLIKAAHNQAYEKARSLATQEISKAGGILPNLMGGL
ncbi:MAG: YbaB/EbfC family nucleoid-associated protein [Treponema sp.]|jgi:DNA-binding YbaB/EbfC family protein|nr:YbaB/EbfC family nucleoid-associated protein [Treponema sp.]